MASVNKCTLLGNLGKDPEQKSFQNGGSVVNFSIATGESWTDKNTGEKKEKTDWHNVVIHHEGLQKVAMQYLRKGSKVYVEGKLQTRKWTDQSGKDCYATEVVLQPFGSTLVMLDGKQEGQSGGRHAGGGSSDNGGSFGGGGFDSDLDDDVPF